MSSIAGFLITVRTARQGVAMVGGKLSPEYQKETATLEVNAAVLSALGLAPGQRARLRSPFGEAVVTCRPAEVPAELFFLPLGPTANLLIGTDTGGTGVPCFKGLEVKLEPYHGATAGDEQ
ncbi:molybdopterin dinucleotide binding domain-containing protein [Moorella sulfitireducens]|uniref:molybdopterin dinucleotide binding domain-containing protein n=1 Tax=Neomoorella sulfitireducens TaxID=2972948 RepID=UPI0021AD211B|nr:molybdopterin dinucleotide binding domain-containing protein [Moorella sulfitireducens]